MLTALPLSAAIELNSIAATVNGKAITSKEVAFHLAPTIGLLRAKYPRQGDQFRKALKEARDKVLERLIDNKLVLSKLEELDAKLPEQVIIEEENRIIREVFNGSEKEFRKNLEQSGMNRRQFRESQKEKILVQAFRQQQFKDVAPATQSEITARYRERRQDLRDRSKDRITFRKIYIPASDPENPAATPETQLALSEQLASQVRSGADFAETVIANSAGAFASEGGLWEDTERLDLEVGFADIVFDTPEGEIVGPLKDRRGFTIVKVLKKNYGPSPPLDKQM
ncbi:MAG: hypothetical protein GWO24_03080, partial [Akkermansiaceae bacterium]|nr:hypothetical protein [Akkermansiaceae bacterium]